MGYPLYYTSLWGVGSIPHEGPPFRTPLHIDWGTIRPDLTIRKVLRPIAERCKCHEATRRGPSECESSQTKKSVDRVGNHPSPVKIDDFSPPPMSISSACCLQPVHSPPRATFDDFVSTKWRRWGGSREGGLGGGSREGVHDDEADDPLDERDVVGASSSKSSRVVHARDL